MLVRAGTLDMSDLFARLSLNCCQIAAGSMAEADKDLTLRSCCGRDKSRRIT
jgi:hypothetical protein